MDIFMQSHGVEVLDLDNALCKEMMAEYISQNPALWDKFLAELDPDLLKRFLRGHSTGPVCHAA